MRDEGWGKRFSAAFLDGDPINDCGKAMLLVDEDFVDFTRQELSQARQEAREEVMELVEEERSEFFRNEYACFTAHDKCNCGTISEEAADAVLKAYDDLLSTLKDYGSKE